VSPDTGEFGRDNERGAMGEPGQYTALPGFSRLDVAGYILALVFPIAGLVVGVILLRRPPVGRTRHGAWIIAVSLVVAIVFTAALIATSHGVSSGEGE
jgi:hypothetical protein